MLESWVKLQNTCIWLTQSWSHTLQGKARTGNRMQPDPLDSRLTWSLSKENILWYRLVLLSIFFMITLAISCPKKWNESELNFFLATVNTPVHFWHLWSSLPRKTTEQDRRRREKTERKQLCLFFCILKMWVNSSERPAMALQSASSKGVKPG